RSSRLADRKSSHALEKGTPWSIIAGSQERGTYPGSPPKAQTPIIAQATVTANQIRHCHDSAVPPAGERLLDNPPKGQAVHRLRKLSGKRTGGEATQLEDSCVLLYIYLIAITAEAMSGALAAGRRNMDLFGVGFIAFITAL